MGLHRAQLILILLGSLLSATTKGSLPQHPTWHSAGGRAGGVGGGSAAGGGKTVASVVGLGGGTDWEIRAGQLAEEKRELEAQLMRLRDENKALLDVRNGQQRTLDPFLFRKRAHSEAAHSDVMTDGAGQPWASQPGGDFGLSSTGEGGVGHGNIVDLDTVNNVMTLKGAKKMHHAGPSAASGAFHRPLTAAQASAVAEAALGEVEREVAELAIGGAFSQPLASHQPKAKHVQINLRDKAVRSPKTEEGSSCYTLVGNATDRCPLPAAMKRATDAKKSNIFVVAGEHHWEGQLSLTSPVKISADPCARLLGAWLLDGVGGSLRDVELCNEFGSCVSAEGGEWGFHGCSVLSSGLAVVQDVNVQHNSINTALYCAGSALVTVVESVVGGLEEAKQAFWGVFAIADARVELANSTISYCLDSGAAAMGTSSLSLRECLVELCCVGVTSDASSNALVVSCALRSNDAAFECGFSGVSSATMTLRDNLIQGKSWNSNDRPIRLEDHGNMLRNGTGAPRSSVISFETKRAAVLRDDDSGDGGEDGGLERAAQRGARRARRRHAAQSPWDDEGLRMAHAALREV